MNKIFTQLIKARHLTDDFLHPKYENLTDPSLLPDMGKAIKRIKKAVENQGKILIYGDYDVDGVTASTLMENALILAGVKRGQLEIMLPDRFIDGYGMSPRLIDRAKKGHFTLIITVDCGSKNHAIIEELNTLKIDTIVTDHHECDDILPEAVAVINPHRHDFTGPDTLKSLAGVGVAFKLAQALVRAGLIKDGQEKWLLDLVLIGTLCDNMEITSENRILTYFGKIVLEKTRRPGLKEIMKRSQTKTVNSETIGFRIGPRLNAAGRLETAEISLNLLRTTSAPIAAKLASTIEKLNQERKNAQRAATSEIEKRLNERPKSEQPPVIIETGSFHEGVIGIVAGRLVEKYHRPTFVLTEVEDGIFKGSGRSLGEFNLAKALDFAKDSIEGGGGHAMAAGVQVKAENLYQFREKINEYYNSLHLKDQDQSLKYQADLEITDLKDLNLEFMEELSLLEPFGAGHKEPIFYLKDAYIVDRRRMGSDGTHLRLDLKGQDGGTITTVAFSAPEGWFNLDDTTSHNFLIQPTINEFNGTRSVEAQLLDVFN